MVSYLLKHYIFYHKNGKINWPSPNGWFLDLMANNYKFYDKLFYCITKVLYLAMFICLLIVI